MEHVGVIFKTDDPRDRVNSGLVMKKPHTRKAVILLRTMGPEEGNQARTLPDVCFG